MGKRQSQVICLVICFFLKICFILWPAILLNSILGLLTVHESWIWGQLKFVPCSPYHKTFTPPYNPTPLIHYRHPHNIILLGHKITSQHPIGKRSRGPPFQPSLTFISSQNPKSRLRCLKSATDETAPGELPSILELPHSKQSGRDAGEKHHTLRNQTTHETSRAP